MVELSEHIRILRQRDDRYASEAYVFTLEALDHTYRRLGERRHVSARELLEGIRDYAQLRFGSLALTVLEHWGVRTTDAFGDIVFHLIDAKVMGRSDADSPSDFHAVFDLSEAFGTQEPLQVEWSDEG